LKKYTLLPFLLILIVLLTSCTRSASTPMPASILSESETLFPVATSLGATLPPVEIPAATHMPAAEATSTPIILEPTAEPVVQMPTQQQEPVAEAEPEEEESENEDSGEIAGGCSPGVTPYQGMGPGFPTFGICGVIRDVSVTVQTNDFIAGQTYTVYMGDYNSGGLGGVVIGSYNTNNGGRYEETYAIPDSLKGLGQIAIRMEFSSGWYATNFFYNQSTQ